MDLDICLVCQSHIDSLKLDAAYPHLTETSDCLPPYGMTLLEEHIYWGNICLECAQLAENPAENEAPGKTRPHTPAVVIPKAGPGSFPGTVSYPPL